MVPPLLIHSSSRSSSPMSAKTSGSSSSGGSRDSQHIFTGSNIMLPTTRAPAAKPDTGDPIEEPVKCVIKAGRLEEPVTASKSRKTCSFPSHRRACGFQRISPMTTIKSGDVEKAKVYNLKLTLRCTSATQITYQCWLPCYLRVGTSRELSGRDKLCFGCI